MIVVFMHTFVVDLSFVSVVMVLDRIRRTTLVSVQSGHNAHTIVIVFQRPFVKTTKFVRANMNSRMSRTINGPAMVCVFCKIFRSWIKFNKSKLTK